MIKKIGKRYAVVDDDDESKIIRWLSNKNPLISVHFTEDRLKKIGNRWAIVSNVPPYKVLKWYGTEKPDLSPDESKINLEMGLGVRKPRRKLVDLTKEVALASGAQGCKGPDGEKGEKGDQGDPGISAKAEAPVYLDVATLSIKNDAGDKITEVDTGALADSDTVVPTSQAVKTAIAAVGGGVTQAEAIMWAIVFGG